MDIINKLHSCFRDCQGFEFGDDFVKIFDQETGKYYKVTIQEEVKHPEKKKSMAISATEYKKLIKATSTKKK